jgi:hypothetical protein
MSALSSTGVYNALTLECIKVMNSFDILVGKERFCRTSEETLCCSSKDAHMFLYVRTLIPMDFEAVELHSQCKCQYQYQ